MTARAMVLIPYTVTAGVLLWAGCRLIDAISDWVEARRRLRRLTGSAVVRLPVPSPDHRGECSPRLAAVPTHRIRR